MFFFWFCFSDSVQLFAHHLCVQVDSAEPMAFVADKKPGVGDVKKEDYCMSLVMLPFLLVLLMPLILLTARLLCITLCHCVNHFMPS